MRKFENEMAIIFYLMTKIRKYEDENAKIRERKGDNFLLDDEDTKIRGRKCDIVIGMYGPCKTKITSVIGCILSHVESYDITLMVKGRATLFVPYRGT
jgi:hypothetical protein